MTPQGVLPPAIFDPRRLQAVRRTGLLEPGADEAFDRITRLAVDMLNVSLAFVTLVDDTRSFWKSFVSAGGTDDLEAFNPVEDSLCQYVIGSGRRLLVDDAGSDEMMRDNAWVSRLGIAAWAGFPIYSPDGEILGTFSVVSRETRHWTDGEEFILESLAAVASTEIALRDAVSESEMLRLEAEASAVRFAGLAHILQDVLVPATLPMVPGIRLAARFRAAGDGLDLSGDFFDVFPRADGQVSLVLGDVAGKGNEAAKTTVVARHAVRTAESISADPVEVLSMLNDVLLSRLDGVDRFVTAAYCTLGPTKDGWMARIARGGHSEPILRNADGSTRQLEMRGMVLGSFETSMLRLQSIDVVIGEGDALVLYSDGVIDARSGAEFFGEERLHSAIADAGDSPDEIADAVMKAVSVFSDEHFADDVAVLVAAAGYDTDAK